jgi:hypothetical protein
MISSRREIVSKGVTDVYTIRNKIRIGDMEHDVGDGQDTWIASSSLTHPL